MRRDSQAEQLLADHDVDGYTHPAYSDHCFANVPGTVLSVLGGESHSLRSLPTDVFDTVDTDVDDVVVLLLDGYGFLQWERDEAELPFLSLLADRGTVTPLTSIYPSETAAAITTMHTGLQPAEHGLLGWDQYFEELDTVLQTLPFATQDGDPAPEVFDDDADPELLLSRDVETVYQRAAADGIESRAFQPESTVETPYTELACRGTDPVGYETVAELALDVRRSIESSDGRTYHYAYVPHVDSAAHFHGTESDDYRAQLAVVTECFRRELVENLDPAAADRTLFVLTADHGHVDTVPAENPDLRDCEAVWELLETDAQGEPIPPVGGPRNVQFHVEGGRVEELRNVLTARYDVLTYSRDEYLDIGLFGDRDPSDRFLRRCPDLVAVHRDLSLWHRDRPLSYSGAHGGMTPDEMLVPFAATSLSALR